MTEIIVPTIFPTSSWHLLQNLRFIANLSAIIGYNVE
jgi:hypothetical protein